MKTKWIKAVVVLAMFLGTYALKDFTQFTDNVYADETGHEHEIVIEEPGDETPANKPVNKDEAIKSTVITESEDGKIATVTCGKDTPRSALEELAADLEKIGVIKLVVKRDGSKKSSEKGRKKKDEEAYELSAADEDDYILAAAWDEILAMLRGNPMYAKDFDNPDLSEALAERIDDRIKRQVEKFMDAYMEAFIKRLSKTQPMNFFDEEEDSDVYFDWDEQKEFIKDANEKLTEEYNELADKGADMTREETVRFRRLHLQLHTLDKLKKAFNRAVRETEEYIQKASGQETEGNMIDGMFPSMPGMPGMDPFNPFGQTQKPQTGWGLNIGSTPWGGVTFGVDRMGENGNWGMSGGYEHVPQSFIDKFGPYGAGGFGGFGGGFNPGGYTANPFANPADFMGLGGGYSGYPGF